MIYEFKFTPEVLNLIAAGLRKLPYEISASLLDNLMREVQAQDAKAEKARDIPAGSNPGSTIKRGRPPKPPANGAAEQQPQAS